MAPSDRGQEVLPSQHGEDVSLVLSLAYVCSSHDGVGSFPVCLRCVSRQIRCQRSVPCWLWKRCLLLGFLLSLLRLTGSHRSSFLQHKGQVIISVAYMPKVALLGQGLEEYRTTKKTTLSQKSKRKWLSVWNSNAKINTTRV